MDIEQSSVEDNINAYHSECKSDCGKENSADVSAGNPDISTIILTSNKKERNVNQPAMECKTEKLSTQCTANMPQTASSKISNKTDLGTLGTKENPSCIIDCLIPDEDTLECKANSTQICSLEVFDRIDLEGELGSLQISGTKENSSDIIDCLIPDEDTLECKANSTQIYSLEVFDRIDLEGELGSLQISNSKNPDKNASANAANLPASCKLMIPDEFASECSPHSSTNITFPENASKDGECRPFNTTERLLMLTEVRAKRKARKRVSVFERISTLQLFQERSQDKGADCQVVLPYQTKNISSECKSSSFQTFESSFPSEIDSDTNVSPASKSSVRDVVTSNNKGNMTRKSSLEVSDESLTGTNFSSSHITDFEDSEKNHFGLEEISNPVILDGDSLNSVVQSKTKTCFKSNLKRLLSEKVESSLNPPEIPERKRTKKQNCQLSAPKVSQREDNYDIVSLTKNNEVQIEFQDISSSSSKPLNESGEAEENIPSSPEVNILQDQDENTLVNLKTLSTECISFMPKLQVSPGYGEDTKLIELARNPKDFASSETNLLEDPINLSKPSPNKISQGTESDQKTNNFQGKTDSKNRDKSRKNSRQNRSRHFSSVKENGKTRLNSLKVHRPFHYDLSDRNDVFSNLKNPSSTKESQQPYVTADDTNEVNRNKYQSMLRKADSQLNSDSNKVDNSEIVNGNHTAGCTPLSIEQEECGEISDVFRAILLQLLLFAISKFIGDYFNDLFFLFLIFIAGYVFYSI